MSALKQYIVNDSEDPMNIIRRPTIRKIVSLLKTDVFVDTVYNYPYKRKNKNKRSKKKTIVFPSEMCGKRRVIL